MTILLPLVGFVLAALAVFLFRSSSNPSERTANPGFTPFACTGLLLAVSIGLTWKFGSEQEHMPLALGLLAGAIIPLIGAFLPKDGIGPASVAIGATGPALLLWLPDASTRPSQTALMIGVLLSVISLCNNPGACLSGTVAGIVACITILGRYSSNSQSYSHVGVVIALGAALLGIVVGLIQKSGKKFEPLSPVLLAILMTGLAYAIGNRYLFVSTTWVCMALGVGSALVLNWVMPNTEAPEPMRLTLSAFIWIGLGTICFGLARGFGTALALGIATAFFVVVDNRRAILTVGPLLSIVLYRVFHQMHPDASRALDIGQHYTMVGFAAGALLPLIPYEWLNERPNTKGQTGSVLWVALLAIVPMILSLILDAKGTVGFIAGLGFCTILHGIRPNRPVALLPIAAGVAGITYTGYSWMSNIPDMTRDDKVSWLIKTAVVVAILAAGIFALGLKSRTTNPQIATEPQ